MQSKKENSKIMYRSLMCGHNRLCYLPGSIKRLHLDSIDLASNLFESMINARYANNLGVPNLVECAARKVINSRYVLNTLATGVERFSCENI
jgi:hypothetical protein